MSGICVALLATQLSWQLPGEAFELRWQHSIEKVEWRESWQLVDKGFLLKEARIKGSGAGMEPGEGARFEDGWWVWDGKGGVLPELHLARSGIVPDYVLCLADDCQPLADWLAGLPESGDIVIRPCT